MTYTRTLLSIFRNSQTIQKLEVVLTKKSGRQSLQNDLNKIITWSKTWQMNFYADKCKIIHFGSRNEGHNYSIEGSILQAASEEKDLGVTVDNTLKFSKQCAEAVKKANKMLGYIARNFEYKSKNIILPLYRSLVRPHLEYAVQLWSPFLKKDI